MGHFFEESAADVFALFVAVDVLVTELQVVGYRAAQTVQSVGKEEPALLQDSRIVKDSSMAKISQSLYLWSADFFSLFSFFTFSI